MAEPRKATRNFNDDLYLKNDLDESILNSPAKNPPVRNAPTHNRHTSTQYNNRPNDTIKEQHEANLRQELVNVRKVNEAIEGVIVSLEKAKSNMKNVNQTVGNASSLLNIWTRILSQTEYNQRLILDHTWQGASQDITDMEDEAQAKQQAAERREAEEQERRTAMVRKAEEEEARRTEVAPTVTKPKPRGRGRGASTRGSAASRAGYVAMGGSANTSTASSNRGTTSTRRTASVIGRGTTVRGSRGRG